MKNLFITILILTLLQLDNVCGAFEGDDGEEELSLSRPKRTLIFLMETKENLKLNNRLATKNMIKGIILAATSTYANTWHGINLLKYYFFGPHMHHLATQAAGLDDSVTDHAEDTSGDQLEQNLGSPVYQAEQQESSLDEPVESSSFTTDYDVPLAQTKHTSNRNKEYLEELLH